MAGPAVTVTIAVECHRDDSVMIQLGLSPTQRLEPGPLARAAGSEANLTVAQYSVVLNLNCHRHWHGGDS